MTDRADTDARVKTLIEPFNKKGAAVSDDTRFAQDLEWDSLTVDRKSTRLNSSHSS